jgi:hypothetical protein
MVRTLDSHLNAGSLVLGKPFYVDTGPQWIMLECEVRMDHVGGPLHTLLVEKRGGFDSI